MTQNKTFKLNISKENSKIGELFFTPETETFSIKLKQNLSPHLKNNSDSKTIENYLKNLIPEGEHLDVITLFLQVSRYNTIELIKLIGSDVTGGICFNSEDKLNTTTSFYEISLDEIIEKLNNSTLSVWNGKVRISVAGVNAKLPICKIEDKIGFGDGNLCSTHILKFDKYNINLVENEYLSLKLADKIIPTCEAEIINHNGVKILKVKRFDREFINNNKIVKKHIIDGCQFLNIPPHFKYQKPYGGDIELINSASIKNFSNMFDKLKITQKEKEKFLDMILYSLVIGNSDFHAKNISFYYENNQIKITPFYDIVNITLFSQSQFENELAMAIGDNFSYNLSYIDFLDFSEDINLNVDFIIDRFESILNQLKNNINSFIVDEKYISIEFFEKYKLNVMDRINQFENLVCEFKAPKKPIRKHKVKL